MDQLLKEVDLMLEAELCFKDEQRFGDSTLRRPVQNLMRWFSPHWILRSEDHLTFF